MSPRGGYPKQVMVFQDTGFAELLEKNHLAFAASYEWDNRGEGKLGYG